VAENLECFAGLGGLPAVDNWRQDSSGDYVITISQQLSTLAGLPTIGVTTTIAVGGIHATLHLAAAFAVALLILDSLGWRIVGPMLDRERFITGTRS
jgi:hypothetical protein